MKNGSTVQINGLEYKVKYSDIKTLKALVVFNDSELTVHQSETSGLKHKEILTNWVKEKARQEITFKCEKYSKDFNFEYNRISIKDTITRWGSCSSKKNLNFSWRLILAPTQVMDYVIVHELCHLKEMNHSSRFWNLVEQILPDYRVQIKWLKDNGMELMAV